MGKKCFGTNIPKFDFVGIPKIMIPCVDSDFAGKDLGLSKIKLYLPAILNAHAKNREKIDFYHNYTLGRQDIEYKKRLYTKDQKNNNRIVENHAYRQVNFKVSCLSSERREFALKKISDEESDKENKVQEIKYLDRYLIDVDYYAKNKNIIEWAYQTGVGVSYECPRRDIVTFDVENDKSVKYRFRTADEGYDIESEAPFEFNDLDPRDNFVVYSSARGNDPLLCVSLVKVAKDNISNFILTDDIFEYKIYIETRYARFVAYCDTAFYGYKNLKFEMEKGYHYMPMIEYATNNARMGIVELNRDLFNSINTLVSNVLDMVVDGANIILVFKNTDIDQKTIDEMKQKGALVINDNPESKTTSQAAVDTVAIKIDFNGLNSFYDERVSQSYDIAGVPLASGQTSNGGDTASARMMSGGWENAYMVIKNDTTSLLKSDYAVLRGFLKICKDIPNCPIKTVSASEIDIKYHINQRDNLLTKAQSIAQLYQVNMPKDEILKSTGLMEVSVASRWEEADEKAKQLGNTGTDLVGGSDVGVAGKT